MTTCEIQQRIESLSASCGCCASDMGFLLKSIVSQIEADKATETFLKADHTLRTTLTEAYVAHTGREIDRLTTRFLTNTQLREALYNWVFNELKADTELKQITA